MILLIPVAILFISHLVDAQDYIAAYEDYQPDYPKHIFKSKLKRDQQRHDNKHPGYIDASDTQEYSDYEEYNRPTRSEETTNDNFVRFGRNDNDFIRFGRNSEKKHSKFWSNHRRLVPPLRGGGRMRNKRSVDDDESNKWMKDEEDKRSGANGFLRFGRDQLTRLLVKGESPTVENSALKRENPNAFLRFGKGPTFGKESGKDKGNANSFLRFGRGDSSNFLRFGRGGDNADSFMRFGRTNSSLTSYKRFRDSDNNFLRFGRGKGDEFMRFGRYVSPQWNHTGKNSGLIQKLIKNLELSST